MEAGEGEGRRLGRSRLFMELWPRQEGFHLASFSPSPCIRRWTFLSHLHTGEGGVEAWEMKIVQDVFVCGPEACDVREE